jgi:hypothetical protein
MYVTHADCVIERKFVGLKLKKVSRLVTHRNWRRYFCSSFLSQSQSGVFAAALLKSCYLRVLAYNIGPATDLLLLSPLYVSCWSSHEISIRSRL